jgi:shikimate kinase/3-dehydroquinate synthase
VDLPDRQSLVFIGFMGAGKTTAADVTAEALGTNATDVDDVVARRLGRSIDKVFDDDGEARFRAVEEQATLELLDAPEQRVLALGGGAVTSPRVQQALGDHTVIWLDVDLHTAWARARDSGRPLARDRAQFEQLHAHREPIYAALANAVVPSERFHEMPAILEALTDLPRHAKLLWAASASSDYPAYIGSGLLAGRFWPELVPGRRFLVTDGHVASLYADALEPLAGRVAIMPGEQSKTIAHAEIVWTELARVGLTREDVVVALGGGVVGDLAGFCAATYQRGVRYTQVPTTLVGQVDSAYGGKTGVDLPEAKNYVGAYHQPAAVIADTGTLVTLPPEELAAGFAEVLKTALIAGGHLWERVRTATDPTAVDIIAACALTKLRIVGRDERDAGLRQVLNLGHTVGHAIETATGYARYRHGEAVGLGLLVALQLSGQTELRQQVRELLVSHNLPTALDGADPDAVVGATALDKKRRGSDPVPFVLLEGPGQPRPGCAVEPGEVAAAVRDLTTS